MILCDVCEETADRSYVIAMWDKRSRIEIAGCKECKEDLWIKIKQLEGRDKMSVDKRLELLGLGGKEFTVKKLGK